MSIKRNFQVRLAARPEGMPTSQHWEMSLTDILEPSDGEVLVETAFVSVDPAMRGWLRDAKSYLPPVAIGEVMRAGGVGTVIASSHPDFEEGDQVVGHLGVQSHAVVKGEGLRKVSEKMAPLSTFLGALDPPPIWWTPPKARTSAGSAPWPRESGIEENDGSSPLSSRRRPSVWWRLGGRASARSPRSWT